MLSLNSIVKTLKRDFPTLTLREGSDFVWSPSSRVITYKKSNELQDIYALFHEVSHGLLNHTDFTRDIDLMTKEAEAWHYSQTTLGPRYNCTIPDQLVEECLETYRDWLHFRSLCPRCSQTGIQTQTNRYSCINCSGSWRVNDARRCRLRRVAEV